MKHQIKLSEIKIPVRMRRDLGDVSSLAQSILELGLIEPIILTRENVLVAGERRYRAHEFAKLECIDVLYTEEADPEVLAQIEWEENYRRKAFTWQEECLGILDIFRKKRQKGAIEGWSWGQRQCADMFGMSLGNMNYVLTVANRLENELTLPAEKRRIWSFNSVAEAYRLGLMAEAEDAANALLVERARLLVNTGKQEASLDKEVVNLDSVLSTVSPSGIVYANIPQNELEYEEAELRYYSNKLNPPGSFPEYWKKRKEVLDERHNTVYLSNKFVQGDCIEYMNDPENKEKFHHIITDPPYAIDMDNLDQQNSHGSLRDLERVVDAHQVDENTLLLSKFFPAAFNCTNDKAFVVVCGDVMLWQHMYDAAVAAGFAVQRWPIIWRKVNQPVMNNCAGYNTTKDFEIVMVCRKPGATLAEKMNTSFIEASNSEATKVTGHPFAKPFELIRQLVKLVSFENQLILEPFAGGGSLVLEFLRQKRNFVAVEKETHHFNSLVENVKREHFLKINPKFIFK